MLSIYFALIGQVCRHAGLERHYEVDVSKLNFLGAIVDIRLIRIYKVVP